MDLTSNDENWPLQLESKLKIKTVKNTFVSNLQMGKQSGHQKKGKVTKKETMHEMWTQPQNSPKINNKTHNNWCKQTEEVKEAQTLDGGALLDVEQLMEAQSIVVPSQSLLVQLEFP